MRVAQARERIGEVVVGAVRAGVVHEYEMMRCPGRPAPEPAFKAGPERAGHDCSRVPEVPAAIVESQVTDGTPGMTFSYKVEYGGPPFIQLWVRSTWVRRVAHAGWAVLDGRAVVDVLAWDESTTPRRPARVRAALVCAYYDSGLHGWRAHADNRDLRVAWGPDGQAALVMPWDEPWDGRDTAPAA